MIRMRRCARCNESKPLEEFHRNLKATSGYRSECRECRAERRANPVTRSKQAISRIKHRIKSCDIDDSLNSMDVIWVLSDSACDYCGAELEYADTTLDHVIPVSRQGPNTFGNIVCACSRCNSSKGDKPVLLYMIQSCEPYANRKLLERLALRRGSSVSEVYSELVLDTQRYFKEQSERTGVSHDA